jgi:glycosyltransferase involved in cell wall biosynthesis
MYNYIMIPVSVVIIVKNESAVIDRCLQSIQSLTDDILVCDTGSTDDTRSIAQKRGARVIDMEWNGYGATKNAAHQHAKYDWIFSLDADEYIDETLYYALQQIDWTLKHRAFSIRRMGYFQGKLIRYGTWLGEKKIRIFPRLEAFWNQSIVHEKLELNDLLIQNTEGTIIENNPQNKAQYIQKMDFYAKLCADKYLHKNIRGARWKKLISPIYNFLFNYFIRLGFLDRKEGLLLCRIQAWYTYKKYDYVCSKKYHHP